MGRREFLAKGAVTLGSVAAAPLVGARGAQTECFAVSAEASWVSLAVTTSV
jgi:hypothetical protein